jgi:hypothetical protein
MRRTRFQQGSLQIVKRAPGRNAWEYRWYELQADGSRKRCFLIIGSVEQYPNEASAQKAVAALRADINAENPRTSLTPISVQTLIEHYREKELGANCSKTRKTQVTYEGYFNKWILPRWGSYRVTEVKAVAVEQWLRSLKYANGSKAKARNIMSAVFNHAVRWEWLGVNPIRMVRQSAKRTRMPIVLSIEQIAALLRIPEGAYAHDGISRRVHGPSGWGVVRPQVEGHRFSEDGDPCHPLNRHATRRGLQDRSLSQAGSTRLATVQSFVELAAAEAIPNR